MSEGVILFVIGTLVTIVVAVSFGLLVNDIQHRREHGPFAIDRKSPDQLKREYLRAKQLHDNPTLLGLNVARVLILALQALIVDAIFILIGVYFIVFLSGVAGIPPLDNPNIRVVGLTLISVALLGILAKSVLDLRDLTSFRNDLMRLINFDAYEADVRTSISDPDARSMRRPPTKRR